MSDSNLAHSTIKQLADLYQKRKVSPVEVVEDLLDRISLLDSRFNYYITVVADEARKSAKIAESEIVSGTYKGGLHGIPLSLKDIIWTNGVLTTCASKVMENYVPDYDAEVVSKLKGKGMFLLGKLNAQEFAMGATGSITYFDIPTNPWNEECVTGGSSSGSGGSIAIDTSIAAIGTDTGGSVRIPAALCGIFGHKPTYGLVSRRGIMALSYTLDHAGPMTKTVEDAAIMLDGMAGHDPLDRSTVNEQFSSFTSKLGSDIKGSRLGIIKEVFEMPHHPEVRDLFEKSVKTLEGLGCSVQEVSIPMFPHARKFHPVISISESSFTHQKTYLTHRDQYGEESQRRLDLGLLITPSDYLMAQQARELLKRQTASVLETVDYLVLPTVPTPAPKIATPKMLLGGKEVNSWGLLATYTCPFNDTGHPAASVPCGFDSAGLPVGLQIVGKSFHDADVLGIAQAYENATDWNSHKAVL